MAGSVVIARTRAIRVAATSALGVAAFALGASSATAATTPLELCVPKKPAAPLVTPRHGACKKGYKLTRLAAAAPATPAVSQGTEGKAGHEGRQGDAGRAGSAGKAGSEGKQGAEGGAGPEGKPRPEGSSGLTSEQVEALTSLLPYIKFVASGIDGKPTIQFSGVNVQVLNGEGSTSSTNGEGNLVIGYDEAAGAQTGSHDLILGAEQTFTSYAGIDAGIGNTISGPYASVTGGENNLATGLYSSVTGGKYNTASGMFASSVSGGEYNTASGIFGSSVSGGKKNTANGFAAASISGGEENAATGDYSSSVSGGRLNTAEASGSSVSGGHENKASGTYSSIFGGDGLEASSEFGYMP
jgi:hypothetical protein